MKFVSPEILTCLAVHPSEEYFATGDVKGVVRLWYCLDPNLVKAVGVEKKSQTSALHWHAHSVSSVAFTTNGAYLLSGGEEAVLVIWQLHTGKREFVPRVGSPISSIAVAPPRVSEEEYLLGLADATYAFVSSTTLKLARVFAHLKLEPSLSTAVPSSSSTPLAFHSLSETLVLPSSHPSSLQTFSPSSFALVAELEVSPSNRVSRRDEKFLEPSRVEYAVISPGGEWMATIDSREGDEYFRGEIYLKFWCWDKRNAFWILNTRIDRPHGLRKITSMSFSPDSSNIQLVTTGADGNVKGWRIRAVKDKKGNQEGRSGRFLVVIGGLDLVVWNVMSQSVLWHVRSNRPYETVVPHPYWDTFITVHPSLSTPSHAVVTIFHALSPVPQLERALPFALRNLICYNVILMGDGVGAQEGLTCHTKTLEKGQVPLRKSLFEEMFGVPALTSVSRDHTPVNPGTALPWRGSETTTFFDAPSHLMPPIHTFFDPFVDSFLHLRTSDEEHPNVPDDDGQGADAEMSVDEEASFVKSTIASADGVLEAFVPVFKEIAGRESVCPAKTIHGSLETFTQIHVSRIAKLS
ncbi:hypothetical protein ID866_4548 [Astraeus odoratus]|nr:hypothetical protein ID866_4548 [Astraeus odoratus]